VQPKHVAQRLVLPQRRHPLWKGMLHPVYNVEEGNVRCGRFGSDKTRPTGSVGRGGGVGSTLKLVFLDDESKIGQEFRKTPFAELLAASETFLLLILIIETALRKPVRSHVHGLGEGTMVLGKTQEVCLISRWLWDHSQR